MRNQETIELRVFHPKQIAPTARKNMLLEGFVRDVVSHISPADLRMRFFGTPNVEAIPGRITGSIPDKYEKPRDTVIVAFAHGRPVGYTDISRSSGPTGTAEIAMLVRTDMQRRGIGKAMMQAAVRELQDEDVKQLEAYIHPENSKMNRALQKWSRTEELQDVTFRRIEQQGEIIYFIELEAKNEPTQHLRLLT